MNKPIAIYARYSSDLQSQASIEDQLRLCSEKAVSQGWSVYNCYSDAGVSGASLMRPGIQALIQDAMNGDFDIVLCESLDRLSRDQEDIAGLYKRMEFAGVKIITLSDGEINTMHIGLKGTMNAIFLQDLAEKTRRGLRGKIEAGKSGGGIGYGYKKVIKHYDTSGEAIKGDRAINEDQAKIIRRIFKEYSNDNKSPKAIAAQLNKETIPSPSGRQWSQSTINGNRRRGTGILNNELYVGSLVWNRQKFIKNPSTGKRVTRLNDESEWIRQELPELRIISQELWDSAKARQKVLDQKIKNGLHNSNRPRYLLSGLLKCGSCGSGYSKINSTHYGCSANKNKGATVCANNRTIRRDILENTVLDTLQTCLMREELVEIFCEEYVKHYNALCKEHDALRKSKEIKINKLEKEKANIIHAIKNGIEASLVKEELEKISDQIEKVNKTNKAAQKPGNIVMHPSLSNRYKQSIADLRHELEENNTSNEATGHLRALIEKIVLTPKNNENDLKIDLYGDLKEILSISTEDRSMKKEKLTWFGHLPSNDEHSQTMLDSVGSGGWI